MKKQPKTHIYRAGDGWRWRLKARNGRIIDQSSEGYTTRSKCVDGFHRLEKAVKQGVEIVYDE